MEKKKFLAILGSPHVAGHCAAMLACAVDAAQKSGWQVDFISLYETNLSWCKGCRECVKTGECVLQDDLGEIAQLIKDCDLVAVAAPTYWGNVPGVVKNLFDRLLGTSLEETPTFPKARLSKKQGYLLFTSCNAPFPISHFQNQGKGAIHAMDTFFHQSGMTKVNVVLLDSASKIQRIPAKIEKRIRRVW